MYMLSIAWIALVSVAIWITVCCCARVERMRLDEYGCLLKNTEEKIGAHIIHMLNIDDRHMYVIAFDESRGVAKTYRVTHDPNTRKPTNVYALGSKPMTEEEAQLYAI
tara:strand:- start:493 stop:816 length:324 start_codon:yes stop_codon:yes gene_type:complete